MQPATESGPGKGVQKEGGPTGSRRPNDSRRGLTAEYVSDVLVLPFDAMRSV